ncbi:hypothetical protein AFLA_007845 [Aspergillus flavus NRRL3357]|nr:hypothetical protein AFLA_007845 [Aspergillus flavus NRRL3357]
MTVRRESPESCAEAKEKCLQQLNSRDGDVSRLETELETIKRKVRAMTRYANKAPSVYGEPTPLTTCPKF